MTDARFIRTFAAMLFSLCLCCGCSGGGGGDTPEAQQSEAPEGADIAAEVEMPGEGGAALDVGDPAAL